MNKNKEYETLVNRIKLNIDSLQILIGNNRGYILESISNNDPSETLLLQHVELVYIHKLKLLEELLK